MTVRTTFGVIFENYELIYFNCFCKNVHSGIWLLFGFFSFEFLPKEVFFPGHAGHMSQINLPVQLADPFSLAL